MMLDHFKIKLCLVILLKSFTYCCSFSNKSQVLFHNESNNVERELDYDDYSVSTEPSSKNTTLNDTVIVNKALKVNKTVIEIRNNFKIVNETSALIDKTAALINETETLISKSITSVNETFKNVNATSNHLKEICDYYEDSEEFDLFKMADVWESKYYRVSTKIPCIRIHIKKTTVEERKFYARKYGDFGGSFDWNNTIMEIKAKEYEEIYKRQHFLNGFEEDRGVLDNVIITAQDNGSFKLLDEAADQWLVIKNLLLMRDCENGEVILFSKIPIQPSLGDLAEALEMFGGETMNGTMVCEEFHKT